MESSKGEGSEFTVLLPVTRDALASEFPGMADMVKGKEDQYEKVDSSAEPPYPRESSKEIMPGVTVDQEKLPLLLIVEDSSDVLSYLQETLKYEFRVEVAGNGKTGLEKALEIIPDIILSDVMMPVMDGIEMLDKVKNDIRTSHIPVVMLTAKADIDSRLAGLERRADAYLSSMKT